MNPDSKTTDSLWYYAHNEATLGPATFGELEAHLKAGTITPETLVVPEGREDWKPLASYLPSPAPETGPQSVSSAGEGVGSGNGRTGAESAPRPPRLPSANRPRQSASKRARDIYERAAAGDRKGCKEGCGGCLVLLVLVFLIGALFETCSSPDLSLSKSELKNPQAAVEKLMKGIYGSKLREAEANEIVMGELEGKLNVYVRVNADMLLSNSSTMFGMDDKMKKALKALYESGLPVWEVVIWNYAPLVDRYGKESDEIVYKVGLHSREASQVNWANVDSVSFDRVWEVRFLHPVLTR